MLDKISEKVLRAIIKKCNGDPTHEVKISSKDIFPRISLELIYSICENLYENEYLKVLSRLYDDTKITLILTYKGYSYFDYKKLRRCEYFKQLLTTSVCSLIVSLATAILTTVLLTK